MESKILIDPIDNSAIVFGTDGKCTRFDNYIRIKKLVEEIEDAKKKRLGTNQRQPGSYHGAGPTTPPTRSAPKTPGAPVARRPYHPYRFEARVVTQTPVVRPALPISERQHSSSPERSEAKLYQKYKEFMTDDEWKLLTDPNIIGDESRGIESVSWTKRPNEWRILYQKVYMKYAESSQH